MALDINVQLNDNYAIVSVKGDIDLYSSPDVRTTLLGLIKKKTSAIYVNLEKVTYMDSSGVATFIEGLQKINKYKGKFALYLLQDNVREVFKLTRLDKIFEIYDSLETALVNGDS